MEFETPIYIYPKYSEKYWIQINKATAISKQLKYVDEIDGKPLIE